MQYCTATIIPLKNKVPLSGRKSKRREGSCHNSLAEEGKGQRRPLQDSREILGKNQVESLLDDLNLKQIFLS